MQRRWLLSLIGPSRGSTSDDTRCVRFTSNCLSVQWVTEQRTWIADLPGFFLSLPGMWGRTKGDLILEVMFCYTRCEWIYLIGHTFNLGIHYSNIHHNNKCDIVINVINQNTKSVCELALALQIFRISLCFSPIFWTMSSTHLRFGCKSKVYQLQALFFV